MWGILRNLVTDERVRVKASKDGQEWVDDSGRPFDATGFEVVARLFEQGDDFRPDCDH